MLIIVLVVIILLMLLGSLPTWPYSKGWGFYPSGGLLGSVVLAMLVWWFMASR